jgi:hypothetical protein
MQYVMAAITQFWYQTQKCGQLKAPAALPSDDLRHVGRDEEISILPGIET